MPMTKTTRSPSEISLEERFMSWVDKTSTCWLWTGQGPRYGNLRINGKTIKAHRCSYELFVGNIPDKMYVLHRCDIPKCVNPKHLFLGDQKDNMDDMRMKGRDPKNRNIPKGEQVHWTKLSVEKVKEIRSLYSSGKYTLKNLGEMFG